jgi:hypothetical protein
LQPLRSSRGRGGDFKKPYIQDRRCHPPDHRAVLLRQPSRSMLRLCQTKL